MIQLVPKLARTFVAALALSLAALAAPAAQAAHARPLATTAPAVSVTDTTATLTGTIAPGDGTLYQFEYGINRYSEVTPIRSIGSSPTDTPVTAVVKGLTPGTVYHFRLVALSWGHAGVGGDQKFATGPAVPAAPAPAPAPSIPAPVAPAPIPVPTPEIGKTMVVAPVAGVVKVRTPGHAGYATLGAGASIPVGALVDTRAGTVQLTSAVGAGRTQAGTFHGGLFQLRQPASGKGMTDLVLRGGSFADCPRRRGTRGRAAAVTKRKPPVRRLWGKDSGGRFRTHGRNSVATVRGTRWVTTDTCAGTRTTVTQGAVAVRDARRHKTVLVRAGHSYLARSR
jgi:hypothetical protein